MGPRSVLLFLALLAVCLWVFRPQRELRYAYLICLTPMNGFDLQFDAQTPESTLRDFFASPSYEPLLKRAALLCYELKVQHQTPHDVVFLTHLRDTLRFMPVWFRALFRHCGCRLEHLPASERFMAQAPTYTLDFFQLTQYARALILDLDMLVEQSLDPLFAAAAPGVTYGVPEFSTATNYGLILMTPSRADHASMMRVLRGNEVTCLGFRSLNGGGSLRFPFFDVHTQGCWQNWDATQVLTTEYFRHHGRLALLSENYNFLVNHYRVDHWTGPLELVRAFHLLNCKPFGAVDNQFRLPVVYELCLELRKRVDRLWAAADECARGRCARVEEPLDLGAFKGAFVDLVRKKRIRA